MERGFCGGSSPSMLVCRIWLVRCSPWINVSRDTGTERCSCFGCSSLYSNDIDLGDAWMIFVSHFRTWDFKNGATPKELEKEDCNDIKQFLPEGTNLEGRKSQAIVSPTRGTNGKFIREPDIFRPSPLSWNCLTSSNIAANRVVAVTIRWDDGMGFDPNVNLPSVVDQHDGCDKDSRFYNGMVVLHNQKTGSRRYWKLKGKNPPTRYINTGSTGPVTMHVLVMPTPSVDYSGARSLSTDQKVTPLPNYGYPYKVDIVTVVPVGKTTSAPALPNPMGSSSSTAPLPSPGSLQSARVPRAADCAWTQHLSNDHPSMQEDCSTFLGLN